MILVFGSTGQLGSYLQRYKQTFSVNKDEGNFLSPEKCIFQIKKHRPKQVIIAAAYTDVESSESNYEKACQINAYCPAEIASYCQKNDIGLIFISTDYVFDGKGTASFKENHPPNPINAYGKSKLLGENLIKNSGVHYSIVRVSWLFSDVGKNFYKSILDLSSRQTEIKIVNDQFGGPTSANSLAKFCIHLSEYMIQDKQKVSDIYHFCGMPYVSWADFAKKIIKLSKRDTIIRPIGSNNYNTKAVRPKNSKLDCAYTQKKLNFSEISWKNDLEKLFN